MRSAQPIRTCRTLPDLQKAYRDNLLDACEYQSLFRRVQGIAAPIALHIFDTHIEEHRLGRLYTTLTRPSKD